MRRLLLNCINFLVMVLLFLQGYSDLSAVEQKEEMGVLLYDTFSTDSNNWSLGEDEYYLLKIENEKLIFRNKDSEGSYFIWSWTYLDGDEPFLIEATMSQTAGSDDYAFGLLWGLMDTRNYFTFNITDDGYYRIDKEQHGESTTLVDWKKSSRINTNGIRNSLQLEKEGNKINFYINGSYVDQIEFESFFGDGVGFVIWNDQTIEIEHITVKGTEDWELLMEDF